MIPLWADTTGALYVGLAKETHRLPTSVSQSWQNIIQTNFTIQVGDAYLQCCSCLFQDRKRINVDNCDLIEMNHALSILDAVEQSIIVRALGLL
ncbi:MAG: hypothetical protein OHK0046_11100 [Anaerolineae bacterium]